MSTATAAISKAESIKHRYEQGHERPLGSFLLIMGTYGSLVATATGLLRRRGRRLPNRIPLADLAVGAIAVHKVARLIAKDPVTSPIRAPFTRFEGQSGEAEVSEEVVGTGLQHALGELVSCPFCLDMWVATGFTFGYVAKPELARTVASVFAMVAAADVLQFGYDALQATAG
jgi:hypothetical protein